MLLYKTIGANIEKYRKEASLTQSQLSEKVGFARTSIVQIERGEQRISIDKLYKISDVLNKDIMVFLPKQERDNKVMASFTVSENQKQAVTTLLENLD